MVFTIRFSFGYFLRNRMSTGKLWVVRVSADPQGFALLENKAGFITHSRRE